MTLTTEQLKERAEYFREKAAMGESSLHQSAALLYAEVFEELMAARKLLANREAQPVAWHYPGSGSESRQLGYDDELDSEQKRNCIALYTAPPAPAKAVAWEMRYWNSGHNMWGDWERITAEQHAEMSVQHATDNDYEFRMLYDAPPVPEGECYKFPGRWIDCTDALPQNGENIITLNNIGGVYGGYIFKRYENGGWDFVDAEEEFRVDDSITHWMPLPAAPEGGNGA
ncbi:DUF551 domain-containing protein [Serratia marcescens]|uniref:DUF551 domain-containing protein n=1 Tax=Serratia marcescens TaxID=615 RepID=UPI003F7FD115